MSKKKTAFENPLIPNARLKHMYRAILRAHLLGQSLPPAQRALTAAREAALVSSALDLTARDLVLDAFTTTVLDFLRGTPLHRIGIKNRVPHPSSARVGSRNVRADSGSPTRLASPANPASRIHSALGAASALKAAAVIAKKVAKQSDSSDHDSSVILSISISGEVSADIWRSALAHATRHDLPVIFLVLPSAKPRKAATDLRVIAHRSEVPAIPVDAADPVALYRVAQESIGHARIGGGPALIECVAFPMPASRTPPAIAHLEEYILSRNIATRAWMDREASSFARRVASLISASK